MIYWNLKVLKKLLRILFCPSVNLGGIQLILTKITTLRNSLVNKFTLRVPKNNFSSNYNKSKDKVAEIVRLLLSISV